MAPTFTRTDANGTPLAPSEMWVIEGMTLIRPKNSHQALRVSERYTLSAADWASDPDKSEFNHLVKVAEAYRNEYFRLHALERAASLLAQHTPDGFYPADHDGPDAAR